MLYVRLFVRLDLVRLLTRETNVCKLTTSQTMPICSFVTTIVLKKLTGTIIDLTYLCYGL